MMQAVILTGGKGTRLSQLYADRPKPLVPVCGKPFLTWQVEWLLRGGVTDIHLAAGHMGEQIAEWAASNPVPGTHLTASVEPQRLGTGGGLKYVESFIKTDPLLVLNGDSLAPNLDFQSLENTHRQFSNDWKTADSPGAITIAVTHIEKTGRYGTVEFDQAHKIEAFLEKTDREEGWINAGVYAMDAAILQQIEPGKNRSIETDIFPALTEAGRLFACPSKAPLLDMGTPEGLSAMETFLTG
jgi:NDP-sugar pyrophosphorylase family protein